MAIFVRGSGLGALIPGGGVLFASPKTSAGAAVRPDRPQADALLLTCIRLLFRTDTNDLAGGVRRGKGVVVSKL